MLYYVYEIIGYFSPTMNPTQRIPGRYIQNLGGIGTFKITSQEIMKDLPSGSLDGYLIPDIAQGIEKGTIYKSETSTLIEFRAEPKVTSGQGQFNPVKAI